MANKLFLTSEFGLGPYSQFVVYNADETSEAYDWLEVVGSGPHPDVSCGLVDSNRSVAYVGYQGRIAYVNIECAGLVLLNSEYKQVWNDSSVPSSSQYYFFAAEDKFLRAVGDGALTTTLTTRVLTTNSQSSSFAPRIAGQCNGVTVNPTNGDIYVIGTNSTSDSNKYNVAVHTSGGTFRWGIDWVGSSTFTNQVHILIVDPSDGSCIIGASSALYQGGSFRAGKFDSNGNFLWGNNDFSASTVIDSDSNIYTIVHNGKNIKKFNSSGTEQWSVSTGDLLKNNADSSSANNRHLALSPDGSKLYCGGMRLFVLDTSDGSFLTNNTTHGKPVQITSAVINGLVYDTYNDYILTYNFFNSGENSLLSRQDSGYISAVNTVTGETELFSDPESDVMFYAALAFNSDTSQIITAASKWVTSLSTQAAFLTASINNIRLSTADFGASGIASSWYIAYSPATQYIYTFRTSAQIVANRIVTVYTDKLVPVATYTGYDVAKSIVFNSDGSFYALLRNFGASITNNDICLYSSSMSLQWREPITTTNHGVVNYEDDVIACYNGATSTDRVITRYRKSDKQLLWSETIAVGTTANSRIAIDSVTGIVYLWVQGSTTIRTISVLGTVGATFTCPNSSALTRLLVDTDNKVLLLVGTFTNGANIYALDIDDSGSVLWSKYFYDAGTVIPRFNTSLYAALWYDSWPVKGVFALPPPTDLQVSNVMGDRATVSWEWEPEE